MQGWRLKKIKIGLGPLAAEFERVGSKRGQRHPVYILVVRDYVDRGNVQLASASDVERPRLTARELDMEVWQDPQLLEAYMTLMSSPDFSESSFAEALRRLHETFTSKDM